MIKLFILFIQLALLVFFASVIVNYSYPIAITFNEIILSTSTSIIIFLIIAIIFLLLFIQRIMFFFKQRFFRFKFNRQKSNYEKGYYAFTQGMIALANKDYRRAIQENKKVSYYLKDESLNLLLKSETLKIEKKFNELEKVYETMLKNENTKILGLKGLMTQNLYAQDYHHAFIYGEKLFNQNHQIDKLYDTLVSIISKTNNWQKLIQINEKAFKFKLINKEVYCINKSIALYEISKIKMYSEISESINLIEKALKLKQYFAPYVFLYVDLLIEENKFSKAKKFLQKAWLNSPHPDFKTKIKSLSNKMKISYFQLAEFVVGSSKNTPESKILLAESLIDSKNWLEAKKQLKTLLEHKPSKKVCLLMSKIEEGDSNDTQKVNAWISRSNFGDLSKVWICQISNISQEKWTSVSNSGYFKSLEWKKPLGISKLQPSNIETNIINYINN